MSYAGISDNYMLMNNALVKGGDPKKLRRKGGTNKDDMFGGEPLKRRDNDLRRKGGTTTVNKEDIFGGEPLRRKGGYNNIFFNDMTGGDPLKRRDDDLRRRGGNTVMDASKIDTNMLGFGSAMKGFTDTIASMSKGGDDNKTNGGCGMKACRKKGGTTGLEIAPFISSLVLLGLRAANDKALQEGITKKLGSLVSEKTTTKSKSKSKTKSKSIFD